MADEGGGAVLHMGTLQYSAVRQALAQSELTTIAPYMVQLMFRNVVSDGYNTERGLVW